MFPCARRMTVRCIISVSSQTLQSNLNLSSPRACLCFCELRARVEDALIVGGNASLWEDESALAQVNQGGD